MVTSSGDGRGSSSVTRASLAGACKDTASVGRVAVRVVENTLQCTPHVLQGAMYRAVGRMRVPANLLAAPGASEPLGRAILPGARVGKTRPGTSPMPVGGDAGRGCRESSHCDDRGWVLLVAGLTRSLTGLVP